METFIRRQVSYYMKDTILKKTNDKKIESGAYKNQFLIYNRKSTDEPENQKNSLQYQKSENLRFALKEHLPIAAVTIDGFCINGLIFEKHSAFKEDETMFISNNGLVQFHVERPKFYKLIQLLNKKLFKGVIFLCWDRASRNDADEAILKKLLKSNIDLRFSLTSYDNSSSGALHMDIDGMFAQHHSRVTSEKIRLNNKIQKAKGVCTYRAPAGYLNIGTMEHKPFDPVRAPIIKDLFVMYATGDWTLSSLTAWAISHGFTMPPMRRNKTREEMLLEEEQDISLSIEPIARIPKRISIHKILTNPFYAGLVYGNDGAMIKSTSHKALITEELFDKVQKQLAIKNRSIQYDRKLIYPYRSLIRCLDCNRTYTPYRKKGILYYCSKCKMNCSNSVKNINEKILSDNISKILQRLIFTEEELAEIKIRVKEELKEIKTLQSVEMTNLERRERKVAEDIKYIKDNKLTLLRTGVYQPEQFIAEEQRLDFELSAINTQKDKINAGHLEDNFKSLEKLSELLKDITLYESFSNSFEKDKICQIIFSELFFSDNVLKYQCKNGFEALENRFVSSGAPNDWLSELPSHAKDIQQGLAELQEYIKQSLPN